MRIAAEQAAKEAARRSAIEAGIAAGLPVITLPDGDLFSPPLTKSAGGKGPPTKPPCTASSAPAGGLGDNEGAARGREAHKLWKPPEGFTRNYQFKDGSIADAINRETHEILELKTSAAEVAKGRKQIERYIQAAEREFGGKWTGKVIGPDGQPW